MTTLVVGASGATGKQLVQQLLAMGHKVRIIVRSPEKLPKEWNKNDNVSIIKAEVLNISLDEMAGHLKGCDAIASCLGHNLTWKGIYGQPRKLVKDATRLLCEAHKINMLQKSIKFVLMNTTGNQNRDLNEHISFGERLVINILRLLLPPHADNEKAADYLRLNIGQMDSSIEWVVVRPDTLINQDKVSKYEIFPSPIRSAIFNPGKTSRINVSHFMASLITDKALWNEWKGQMPVIYNIES
ncbi:NAD(P)-binding oxidoreductase [Ekhidna sp.]|uniref:NAD(P)-dependent oxidoreductase n=1 Tax=Ekhidna sp. TaxID=2608089 RepID=UPI0032EB5A98